MGKALGDGEENLLLSVKKKNTEAFLLEQTSTHPRKRILRPAPFLAETNAFGAFDCSSALVRSDSLRTAQPGRLAHAGDEGAKVQKVCV